jgi:hypothetical protein
MSTDGGLSYQSCFWFDGDVDRGELTVISLPSCAPQVVISDLYGAGNNSGAIWRNDFAVLHNRSLVQTVSLTGWSFQYGSATGSTWAVHNLSGTISPGGYFLVQMSGGTTNGAALPTADLTIVRDMGGSAGKLALVSSTTALSGACPTGGNIVDFVGFGSTANCSETAPTLTVQTATSGLRLGDGCTDTNNNSADFATSTAAPKNSSSPVVMCGCN